MKTLLLAALTLSAACATVDHEINALAHDQNVTRAIQSLVEAAGDHLTQAIDLAENNAVRVLAIDPNGVATDAHAATELRRVKSGLDALNPQVPTPVTRFVRPE